MKRRTLLSTLLPIALVFPMLLAFQGTALGYSGFGTCTSCHSFGQGSPEGMAWHQAHESQSCIQGNCLYCHQQDPALDRNTCKECHKDNGLPSHHECAGASTSCVGCHGSSTTTEDADISGCLDECADALDNDGDCLYDGDDSDCASPQFTLLLDLAYVAGNLSLDFTIGTPEAVTWGNYLVLTSPSVRVIPLWTVPLTVLDPPISLPLAFPLPSVGVVGIYSGLFTAGGLQAMVLEWTGT